MLTIYSTAIAALLFLAASPTTSFALNSEEAAGLEGLEYINAVRIQYSALKLIWDVAVAEGLKESFATMPTCNYPKLHGQKVKGSLECILATMLFTGECSVLIFLTIKKNNTARTSFFQMSWWREGRLLPVGHQVLVLKNYIL